MTSTREEVLCSVGSCDHAAHLYVDDASLVEAVGVFGGAALGRGEALALVATEVHLRAMMDCITQAGRDVGALRGRGQLICVDAVDALGEIMLGDRPDRTAFESLVRPLITRAQEQFGGVSVYGELVNILWHESNRDAAHTLEQWWNDQIAEYGFSLLCGYRVDVFDFQESVQEGIDTICATHTHLLPVAEYERLEHAIDAAMREVFQNGDAAALKRHLLSRCDRPIHMPPAQAALLALRDILPSLAQDVRMIARDHYRRSGPVGETVLTA